MSFKAMAWAWEQRSLSATERLTLLSLTNFAGAETNSCWPRVRTLAADAGISESAVTRALGVLEEKGLIEIEARYRDDGSKASSLYRLIIELPPGATVMGGGGVTQLPPTVPLTDQEPSNRTQVYKNPVTKDSARTVSEEFLAKMVSKYEHKLGGANRVIGDIADALNHKASLRWMDVERGVDGWLRRNAERIEARGENSGNAGAKSGPKRSDGATRKPSGLEKYG